MQTIASYLLEDRAASPDKKNYVRERIYKWLKSKGVAEPEADSGSFDTFSLVGGGKFSWQRLEDEVGGWEQLTLVEMTDTRHELSVRLQMVYAENLLAVHVTLWTESVTAVVRPHLLDARCPGIVRELLRDDGAWKIESYPVPSGDVSRFEGDIGGQELVRSLISPSRIVPLVVVSRFEGEEIWSGLAKKIAYDLTGLANVALLDESAAWELTEKVSKRFSVYGGGVRLYWPTSKTDDLGRPFPGALWTPQRLLSADTDEEGEEQLRRQLRSMVMRVSAYSIPPPKAIYLVRSAAAQRQIRFLLEKLEGNDEAEKIVQQYSDDAKQLRAENESLREELSGLRIQLENAETIKQHYELQNDQGDNVKASAEESGQWKPPAIGEKRYYKKIGSTPNRDKMIVVNDCGHNAWESAYKADKAWKGVAQFEGRDDWKSFLHCSKCTNGGRWKVQW